MVSLLFQNRPDAETAKQAECTNQSNPDKALGTAAEKKGPNSIYSDSPNKSMQPTCYARG
jgi:hypothetical protein